MTNITLNVDYIRRSLLTKINGHHVALKMILDNLESENFIEKAELPRRSSRISLTFKGIDIFQLPQQECNKCFRSIIQSTMDFLDQLIALKNIQINKIKINKVYANQNDFLNFLNDELRKETLKVSGDRSLSYKKKVDKFMLDKFSSNALYGYIDLRHCLEHNKEIPNDDIKLVFKQLIMIANNQKIKKLPFIATSGTVNAKIAKGQKTFKNGQKVEVDEQIIENVIFTLQNYIIPKIMTHIISKKRG